MILTSDHESVRQHALDSYRIVDSLPEGAYDEIVRLAALLCDAPTALVSLIDRDRQWFKARTGLDAQETPRGMAFCDHAIRNPDVLMEIPDAALDPRFSGNLLVTGEPRIRFYAGMPLVTPCGEAIGTVCVIDREPRMLTENQRAGLASLSRLTMSLLAGRLREHALARASMLVPPSTSVLVQPSTGPAAGAPADATGGYTVAIFELQDFVNLVARDGDRDVEKAMQHFEQALKQCLRSGSGDAVSRTTGSHEFIVILQGSDCAATLRQMRDCVPAVERETGTRLLVGSACASAASEPMDEVFMRADEALSVEKTRFAVSR